MYEDDMQKNWIFSQDIGMELDMRHDNNEKCKTTKDERNRTTKSRKNQNARRKGNLQVLGNIGSRHPFVFAQSAGAVEYTECTSVEG